MEFSSPTVRRRRPLDDGNDENDAVTIAFKRPRVVVQAAAGPAPPSTPCPVKALPCTITTPTAAQRFNLDLAVRTTTTTSPSPSSSEPSEPSTPKRLQPASPPKQPPTNIKRLHAIAKRRVASALASQQAHAAAARDLSKQFDVPDPKAVYGLQRFLDSIESVR